MGRRPNGRRGRPTGGAHGGPVVTAAPVLGGATYAGGTPFVAAPTYSDGGAPDSYTLLVNGAEVASGDESTIEAYVYTLADEGLDAVLRAHRDGVADSDSDAVPIDLAAEVSATLAAVSWVAPVVLLARQPELDLALDGSTVNAWLNHGTGSDAALTGSGTVASYDDGGVNDRPAVAFAGARVLSTGTHDLTAYSAAAIIALFQDTNTGTTAKIVAEHGNVASTGNGALAVVTNDGTADTIESYARANQTQRALSDNTHGMATPGVVMATADLALTTNEAEVWHDGELVTSIRPSNVNNTTTVFGNFAFSVGGRVGVAQMTGSVAVAILAAGVGPITGDVRDALLRVCGRVGRAWGLDVPLPYEPTETELSLQAALDESALEDVYVHLARESDGHEYTLTKGTPNQRYITSSTVKPITCTALLWGEHQGWFTRESLIVDLVPEFSALATSEQRNIRMKHLMSFTSGLFATVTPSNATDWQDFVDNCAALATAASDPDFVPGTMHFYATDQHALASVAAVNASPHSTWDEYMTAFIADTGLFSGATWANQVGLIFGGNVQMSVTAQEYVAFLRAIFNATILTEALCQDLYSDVISARAASHDFFLDAGMTAEEWHFGRGIWLEQRHVDWVPAEGSTRIGTIGNAGQYAYHDLTTGVTLVVSVTFPAAPEDFVEGLVFARSIDALVETWSAEGA